MWNLKGYTLKAQSLDTDVQRPFYSVAIIALLPYYVQRPFYSVAIVALLPYYVQRPFYSVAIVALLPFLNMGRERRWPRWIKKASHIGSKRLWIWAPIGSHHPFVIGWFRYRLWLPGVTMHCMLTWMVGIPTGPTQSPLLVHLHSRNDTKLPAVWTVQGDCERVYVGFYKCYSRWLHWHRSDRKIVLRSLYNWIFLNALSESTRTDSITTSEQSETNRCAYIWGWVMISLTIRSTFFSG